MNGRRIPATPRPRSRKASWSRRRRTLAGAATLLLPTAMAVAGCESIDDSAPKDSSATTISANGLASGGTITYGAGGTPTSAWNPLNAESGGAGDREILFPLFPHAFTANADHRSVLNKNLLKSAKVISEQPMVIQYDIQPTAVWSDGEPITSEDFKYTWQVQDPQECPKCKASITKGYSKISSVRGGNGGKTVTVTFAQPFALWKHLFPYILPSHVAKKYGDLETSFNQGMAENVPKVSGGAYMVRDYKQGVSLTLVKNPKWYGSPVHLDKVIIRWVEGDASAVKALTNGEVDAISPSASLDIYKQLQDIPGVDVQVGPVEVYYFVAVAPRSVTDPVLRRALLTVIDSKAILERTVGQYAHDKVVDQNLMYVPGQQVGGEVAYEAHTDQMHLGTGDVERAKKMLRDAGYTWKNDKLVQPDGKPLRTLTYLTYASDPVRKHIAEICQSQLAKLGVKVVLDAQQADPYLAALFEGSFDLATAGNEIELGPLAAAQWFSSTSSRNYGYTSKRADSLLDKAITTIDPNKRVEIMNELDRVVLKDAVMLPMFTFSDVIAYRSKYANIHLAPSKYGHLGNLAEWGIKK